MWGLIPVQLPHQLELLLHPHWLPRTNHISKVTIKPSPHRTRGKEIPSAKIALTLRLITWRECAYVTRECKLPFGFPDSEVFCLHVGDS